jgi:haloacetate dehalogenase
MRQLGFERFALAGHDRGARVAYRLALDHPQAVTRLALLDIVPIHTMLAHVDRAMAANTFHWFFLSQPADLPEHLERFALKGNGRAHSHNGDTRLAHPRS